MHPSTETPDVTTDETRTKPANPPDTLPVCWASAATGTPAACARSTSHAGGVPRADARSFTSCAKATSIKGAMLFGSTRMRRPPVLSPPDPGSGGTS